MGVSYVKPQYSQVVYLCFLSGLSRYIKGVKRVSSITELIEMFKSFKVDAISFSGSYQATTVAESIRMAGGLD